MLPSHLALLPLNYFVWCKHDDFSRVVRESWTQPACGEGLVKFTAKLKRLKPILRKRNKEVFGRMETQLQDLEDEVLPLEVVLTTNYSAEADR